MVVGLKFREFVLVLVDVRIGAPGGDDSVVAVRVFDDDGLTGEFARDFFDVGLDAFRFEERFDLLAGAVITELATELDNCPQSLGSDRLIQTLEI